MKTPNFILVALICLLSGCASEPGLDGQIFTTDDGRVFELQHRFLDAYLVHKLDAEKMMAEAKRVEQDKAR